MGSFYFAFLRSGISSDPNFHLHPRNASEPAVKFVGTFVESTANQLLISSNIEDFNSSTIVLDITIFYSHCHQCLFMVVEVYLHDMPFILGDDALNSGDLFGWVKRVCLIEVFTAAICTSFARLAIN